MGHHDAATLRRAVALLIDRQPSAAVLAVGATPLSSPAETAAWMSRAASHTAGLPYCCRFGAIGCPYAGPALHHARRIIAAASPADPAPPNGG